MASKRRTWPRREEVADSHPRNKSSGRGNGRHADSKRSFPLTPREKSKAVVGDAGDRGDDHRLGRHRPLAINSNGIEGDALEEFNATANNGASTSPTARQKVSSSQNASTTPLQIWVDAASPTGRRFGTSTGGMYG